MTKPAHQLLSLLGILPDGIARSDLEVLLPELGNAASATLRQSALAFEEAGRLRMLAPVREYAAARHQPLPEVLARAIGHYAGLATDFGRRVGAEGGVGASAKLAAEAANIEQMLLSGLASSEPQPAAEAAVAFAEFQRFSGLGTAQPLDAAVEASQSIDDSLAAKALFSRGLLALHRSDHDGARARFEAALPLYRRLGDLLGEANCIRSLGDIALARSDHDGARERYEEALGLYTRIREPYSIGLAHRALAKVARDDAERVRHVEAAREAWLSIGRDDLVRWLDGGGEA
jgi:tetratricopeptide (TPR) repeat protein